MTVKIKICGITNLADALLAAKAGADYLGFILWPGSKRYIRPDNAQILVALLRQLPQCPILVGVFVNDPAGVVANLLDLCDLDVAQLSGDEPASFVGDPQSPLYGRSYKTIRPASLAEAEAEAEWYLPPEPRPDWPRIHLDTPDHFLRGGTGRTINWDMAAKLSETIPNLMLAGGLTPDNVAQAIANVRPYAVDVASGVEISPGQKSPDLLQAFIANARL